MLHTLKQTHKTNTPLRFAHSNSALRRITTSTPEAFRATIRDYVNARKKERNTITINTKKTRPVFVDRDNPDTPPTITDSTREFASLMRNTNSLIAHASEITRSCVRRVNHLDYRSISPSKIDKERERTENRYPRLSAWHTTPGAKTVNGGYCEHHPYKPLLYGGKIETCADNVNHCDKPAFRHDSMYLFDVLSEDYNA